MRKTMIALSFLLCTGVYGQQAPAFNGLDMNLGNLSRLSDAKTRSISPENFTGARGKGGMADPSLDSGKRNVANAWHAAKDLGKGWKVNPFIEIKSNETITIAEIEGPGAFLKSNDARIQSQVRSGQVFMEKMRTADSTGKEIKVPTKLGIYTPIQGTGPKLKKGDLATLHYIGQIYPDGTIFDESWSTGPRVLTIDVPLIKGWIKGLVGQRVGSRVVLVVPPSYGYGDKGQSTIHVTATTRLIFEIDILGVGRH